MNDFDQIRAARPAVAPPSDEVMATAKAAMWSAQPSRGSSSARRRRLIRIPIAITAVAAATALVVTFVRIADDRTGRQAGPGITTTPTHPVTSGLPAPVTLADVGGATLGMTATELSRAWGTRVVPAGGTGPDCQTAQFTTDGVRGFAIFSQGRLASLWFSGPSMRTDLDIGVGSTLAAVRRAYTPLTETPSEYNPTAIVAYYEPNGSGHAGLRFSISAEGSVAELAWGDKSIHLLEGCA
jgi:hypothetical protein